MSDGKENILVDLIYSGDPEGHGGHHRSAQIKELIENAGFNPVISDFDVTVNNFLRYIYGIYCIMKYKIPPGLNWRWLRRWGGSYHRYLRMLNRYNGKKVLIIENTRPYNQVAFYIAKSHGFNIVAVPQNSESLEIKSEVIMSSKYPSRKYNEETRCLSLSDSVYCISREEAWLYAFSGLKTGYLPYYPPGVIINSLKEIRKERQKRLSDNTFLVLGSSGNPFTKQGICQLLDILNEVTANINCKIEVVGSKTEEFANNYNNKKFNFNGRVDSAKLRELLIRSKALIVYQRFGIGALTRIPEMLVAGIPVIGNIIACRSAFHYKGVYEWGSKQELIELLKTDLLLPPEPEPPLKHINSFTGELIDIINRNSKNY